MGFKGPVENALKIKLRTIMTDFLRINGREFSQQIDVPSINLVGPS